MKLSKLAQPQGAAPVATADAPKRHQLRTLHAAVRALIRNEGEQAALGNPRVHALLRELGVTLTEQPKTGDGVPAMQIQLDEQIAELLQKGPQEDPAIRELAKALSNVFGHGPSERSLLELALHANRDRKLQRAMNLVGPVDDEEAAELFADILGLEHDAVLAALGKPNPFSQMQTFDIPDRCAKPFHFIRFDSAATNVVRYTPSLDAMLALVCRPSPKARLAMADFAYQADELDVLKRYLQRALETNRRAVNILLHGAPGTGKTEMVRALAAALEAQLVEVPAVDEDKDPLPPSRRLTALTATQDVMRAHMSALVLFDEVEDVFPLGGFLFGAHHGRARSDRRKAWLTQVLEENARPTFWVCNEIGHIDPAYIRRFDMVIELSTPGRVARECLIDGLFAGISLKPEALEELKAESALAPAHLERIAGVLKAIEPANDEDAGALLYMLERQTRKALELPAQPRAAGKVLPYRPDCINTSINLEALAAALETQPTARLCLFGPPGTGKTEWTRQLARRLGRPLHTKRASDLLSKFVGDSERLMRQAFEVAAREGAVLLIDEADGLLRDRMSASHGWEVSMINELLTCMETFEGIFVASTNLQERLDPASARRFDFKVKFDYLSVQQARRMLDDLVQALGIGFDAAWSPQSSRLARLAPGDFANVFRQVSLVPVVSAEQLVELLAQEAAAGPHRESRQMGFIRYAE